MYLETEKLNRKYKLAIEKVADIEKALKRMR